MKKIVLLLLPFFISITAFYYSKDITITGTVTNELGNPLSATIHAGKVYAVTSAEGNYRISINENEDHLIFSAIGYVDQKIKIASQRVVNVKLKTRAPNLGKVVVAEYGIKRESKRMAYPVATFNGKTNGINSPYPRGKYFYENDFNTEDYDNITENGFKGVLNNPLSTFSIDVDAASYSNVRRFLNNNKMPPAGAVRAEEMINYFTYQYPQPQGDNPFSVNTEISDCPWNPKHKLVLIGLQGKKIPTENLPSSNLVFLVDVSGSMMGANRLPLVKASLKMLTNQLRENDRISIVVYAGQAGLVLPATSGSNKIKIKTAIDALQAGGSTAGGAGIQLAYATAQQNFMKKGNNRVILCTDGDFNVGVSSDDALVRLIEKERQKGIFLTVLGYGMGNYKDNKMQQLADKGNGNHAYIDGLSEAKKVLVTEFGGTLFTIAKDVKLQVEFNPAKVAGYRLIGYENRMLNKEDFNDDKKDAGELGSGHSVTALYEIIPAGTKSKFLKEVSPLKYQSNKQEKVTSVKDEILTVKLRYKLPDSGNSELITHVVKYEANNFKDASDNFRFAASVAGFAMLLRDSKYKQNATYNKVISMAGSSLGNDVEGYRKELVKLVKKAASLIDLVKNEEEKRTGIPIFNEPFISGN